MAAEIVTCFSAYLSNKMHLSYRQQLVAQIVNNNYKWAGLERRLVYKWQSKQDLDVYDGVFGSHLLFTI